MWSPLSTRCACSWIATRRGARPPNSRRGGRPCASVAQSLGRVTSVSKRWAARLAGQHASRPARLFLAVSAARVLGRRVKRHYVRGIFPRRTANVTSYIRVIGWTLLVVTVVHGHATGRWSELHGLAMVLASVSIVGAEVR